MNEVIRNVIAVSDRSERLRDGSDPTRPAAIGQPPSASERLRRRTDRMGFRRLGASQDAVDRVRVIRDGGEF